MKHYYAHRRPKDPRAPRIAQPDSALKPKRRCRDRRPAKAVIPTLVVAAMLATWTLHSYCPALLLDTGHFIWGIKSSVIELGLAILASGMSKRR